MADEPLPPNFDIAIQMLSEVLYDPAKLQRLEKAFGNAIAYGSTVSAGAQIEASGALDDKRKGLLEKGEDLFGSVMAFLLSHLVAHMLGVEVPPNALRDSSGHPGDSKIGRALATTILGGMQGPSGQLEPGDDGANRFIGMLSHLTIQGWFEGIIVEEFQSLHGVLHPIESVSKLGKDLISGLGLSRLARTALRPLVRVAVATPLEWKTNKTYRPTLLSESLAVRQFLRGIWTREQLNEELARQGWSDTRIEAHINAQSKFLSLDEMLQLRRFGAMTDDQIQRGLRDQGYDEFTAAQVVSAKTDAALETIERSSIGAIQRAYIDRRIELSEMTRQINAIVSDGVEAAYYVTAATAERDVNTKWLSPAEAKACVKAGVLSMIDYRKALQQDGYNDDAIFALELLFRKEIDDASDVADHALEQVRERAALQAAKDAEAAAKKAQVDADRALNRRGSLAMLERAVVRGLIPVARYAEVLQPQYDADTVQIMVGLIQQARADYVDTQQRAEDARKRAAIRNVDVGALDQAVLTGVLTLDEFRSRLESLGFSGADAGLLTDTLGARLADAAAAADVRAQAQAAAKVKSIDLGRFERLVVRGVRTLDEYRGLLASLGFDEGSQAAMVELLQLQVADAAAAAEQRRLAALKASAHDVTLEQMRRAVVLGLQPEAAYQTYLVSHGFTTDAQAVLLGELRADVADAEAARARRAAADAATQARVLPLSTLARAARLGIVSVDVYQRRLAAAGYSTDDIAIELELLAFEMDAIAAAKAKRAIPAPVPDSRGLTLAQTEKAVKAGLLTLQDYQARAFALGYAADAVATLVDVLGQELDTLAAAQAIHDGPSPAPTRDLSVAQYEAAVKAGAMTLDEFTANVQALGYAEDAAALLTFLLTTKLPDGTGG